MPTTAEFVYSLLVRDIDGQARDLESMRSHLGIAISAGGVVAAIFAAADNDQSVFFWLGAASFAGLVACAIYVFWPLDFRFNPSTSGEVEKYLGGEEWEVAEVAKDLATEATDAREENQVKLDRRWNVRTLAFLLLAAEVTFFMLHAAFDAGSATKQTHHDEVSVCRDDGGTWIIVRAPEVGRVATVIRVASRRGRCECPRHAGNASASCSQNGNTAPSMERG